MDFYFKNIRLIDPATERDEILNIRILEGKFSHISKNECETLDNTNKIDGTNLVMTPGLIDIHVHLREPGYEYKETIKSGTASAANGGFTSVVCMPNTKPDIDDVNVVKYINEKSLDNPVEVLISAAITKKRKGQELTDFQELSNAGVVLFTDDGAPVSRSDIMKSAFENAANGDLLLSQHCEDHSMTTDFSMNESELSNQLGLKGYPDIAEEVILFRDIKLAEYCGKRRYHAQHLSTAGAIDLVRDAKKCNQRVTCEVTPHHFILSEENLKTFNSDYKMNPPLRQQKDIDAIIGGIIDGTVDCIATDHAPHSPEEKSAGLEKAPNGIIGLETSLGLCLTYLVHKNHITLYKLIELMATNPRKVLNHSQPIFEVGSSANVTVFNPNEEWTVDKHNFLSKSINSPFDGFILNGKPKYIFNNNLYFESKL
jgi:dihydroorotase